MYCVKVETKLVNRIYNIYSVIFGEFVFVMQSKDS